MELKYFLQKELKLFTKGIGIRMFKKRNSSDVCTMLAIPSRNQHCHARLEIVDKDDSHHPVSNGNVAILGIFNIRLTLQCPLMA